MAAFKIDCPVEEIRSRAIKTLHSKLDKGLIREEELLDSDFLIRFLGFWFGKGRIYPKSAEALRLLKRICEFPSGVERLKSLETRKVLSRWRLGVLDSDLREFVSEILEKIPLDEEEEEETQDDILTISKSLCTTLDEDLSNIIPKESAIPGRLILPTSSLSLDSPYFSPVRRNYFNKKVQFSESEDYSSPQEYFFPWISLSQRDSIVLEELYSKLSDTYDPNVLRGVTLTLRHSTFQDYPPEVFLQRPNVLRKLIEIFECVENSGLKMHVGRALDLYANKLMKRVERDINLNFKESYNLCSLGLNVENEDEPPSEGEDFSLEDHIQTITLKKRRLSMKDFCLVALSLSVSILKLEDKNEHIRLINSLYDLIQSLIRLLTFANLGFRKKDEGRLREIAKEMSENLEYHHLNMKSRFHRVVYLLLLKLGHQLHTFLSSSNLDVDRHLMMNLSDSVFDPTLYFTHPSFHSEILNSVSDETRNTFESEIKPTLQSISHAVQFMKGTSKDPIKSASKGVHTLPFHECYLFLTKFFKLCAETGDTRLQIPIQALLKFKDVNIRTEVYLGLHSLIQETLGLSHAISQSDPAEKVKFMYQSSDIFAEILKTCLMEQSVPIITACEEILIYFLKSENILKSNWQRIISTVLLPNILYFESLVSTDNLLGKLIFETLNPDPDMRLGSGLSRSDTLRSNVRLLYRSSDEVRDKAEANLKFCLSQEVDSCLKLPRFSDVLGRNMKDFLIIDHKKPVINFRNLSDDSSSRRISEFIKIMEVFCLSLELNSSELLDPLKSLVVLLEDSLIMIKFLECDGFNTLIKIWNRIVKEDDTHCGPELLPPLLDTFKILIIKNTSLRRTFDSANLYLILRSMLMLNSPRYSHLASCKTSISVTTALILFDRVYWIDDFGRIIFPEILESFFTLPFEHQVGNVEEKESDGASWDFSQSSKSFNLYKFHWNLCWEGSGVLYASKTSSDCKKRVNSRVVLSEDERVMVSSSLSNETYLNPFKILLSRTPNVFLRELDYLNCHRLLISDEHTRETSSMNYAHVFKKFLILEPSGKSDAKILSIILDFLRKEEERDPLGLKTWVEQILTEDKTIFNFFLNQEEEPKFDEVSIRAVLSVSNFLATFGKSVKFKYFINRLRKGSLKSDGNNLLWVLKFVEFQIHHCDLLDCCDIASFILSCLTRDDLLRRGYYKSRTICLLLLTLKRIAKKTLTNGDFDALEIFGRTEWLVPFFSHKCVSVRTLAFQISSLVAISELGADSLTKRFTQEISIWEVCLGAFMNREESLYVRFGALESLTNLLNPDHRVYYGPIIKENISGVIIRGESALSSFLKRTQFEEEVIFSIRQFGLLHKIKYEETEDSCGVEKSNYSTFCEEQIISSPFFLAGLLRFIYRIHFNEGYIFSALNVFGSVDISDKNISSVIIKFPISDYVKYLEGIILLYVRHFPKYIDVNYLTTFNAHLSSVLFLAKTKPSESGINSLKVLLWIWMSNILRRVAHSDTDVAHKLGAIFNKYEQPLLESTTESLREEGDEGLKATLIWIISYASFRHKNSKLFFADDTGKGCYFALQQELFITVLAKYDMIIEGVILQTSCKLSIVSFCNQALCSLLLLPVRIDSETRKKIINSVETLIKEPSMKNESTNLIRLLNNLCFRDEESKYIVSYSQVFLKVAGETLHNTDTLSFLMTLSSNSNHASVRVGIMFTELLNVGKKRSNEGKMGIRLLTILAANSSEVRSSIYKSNFLTGETMKESPILYTALDPKNLKKSIIKKSDFLVLMLDLLVTVTSFQDGQRYVAERCKEVMDFLLLSLQKNNLDILSLAVLRNLSFLSSNRARMLLCKEYLSILKTILSTSTNKECVKICLWSVWSLSHNSLKAKAVMREAGVTQVVQIIQGNDPDLLSLLHSVKSVLICDK